MIDWDAIRAWGQLAFTLATAGWAWLATRHRATVTELHKLSEENQAISQRLALAEQSLLNVPKQTEFERLAGDLRVLSERLEGVKHEYFLTRQVFEQQISRMDTFLRGKFT